MATVQQHSQNQIQAHTVRGSPTEWGFEPHYQHSTLLTEHRYKTKTSLNLAESYSKFCTKKQESQRQGGMYGMIITRSYDISWRNAHQLSFFTSFSNVSSSPDCCQITQLISTSCFKWILQQSSGIERTRCMEMRMSDPPRNSPLTYTCGMVGHLLHLNKQNQLNSNLTFICNLRILPPKPLVKVEPSIITEKGPSTLYCK